MLPAVHVDVDASGLALVRPLALVRINFLQLDTDAELRAFLALRSAACV